MIFCCGEALIDMVPNQTAMQKDIFVPMSGGALFNTAIALGRLGEKVGFISGISRDMFGETLINSLKHSNVSTQHCIRSDRPTTLAFMKLINGDAQYSFYDENSAGRMITKEDLDNFSLPEETFLLHFGGISLVQEPCGSTYEALMRQESHARIISLDPNIRPGFIINENTHRARIMRMIALSDILKVSEEDLQWIAKGQNSGNLIKSWLADGCSIILVTKGGDGVEVYSHHGRFDMPATRTKIIDTVGAGDAFNAGFLASLNWANVQDKAALTDIKSAILTDAVQFATRVAAITVSRSGANPPWLNEL